MAAPIQITNRILAIAQRRKVVNLAAALGIAVLSKFLGGCQVAGQLTLSQPIQSQAAENIASVSVGANQMGPNPFSQWVQDSRVAILTNHLEKREVQPAEPVAIVNFPVPEPFQGKIVREVALPDNQKAIALTFDDGPWPITTPKILDILEQNQVVATFFWVGQHLRAYSEIARETAIAGHEIGNHTWNHHYHQVSEAMAANEIDNTAVWINRISGSQTQLFRPPGGHLTNGLAYYAQKKKYAVVMWSTDSGDTQAGITPPMLVRQVLDNAKPGGIVLLHDGGSDTRTATVEALPEMIEGLKAQGYRFVTVTQLLEMSMRQSLTADSLRRSVVRNTKARPGN